MKDVKKKDTKKKASKGATAPEDKALLEKETETTESGKRGKDAEILDLPKAGFRCMQKSLLNILGRAYWKPFMVAGIFKLGHDLLAFGMLTY